MSACALYADGLEWRTYLEKAILDYVDLPWHDLDKLDDLETMLFFAPAGINVKKYKSEVSFHRGLAEGESLESLRGDYFLGLED